MDQTLKTIFFSVKHSLKYFLTDTSGTTNFPKFVGVVMMDEVPIGYCDSHIKRAEAKQDWIRKLFKLDPKFRDWYSEKCLYNHQLFEANINVVKQRLNQTEGSLILQSMTGCEWDDESGEVKGFDQYGYDGEDFISLDLQAETWITPKAQAIVIKHLWDEDKGRIKRNKDIYMSMCPEHLKKCMYFRTFFGQRTGRVNNTN
uniref:MHC class I-like antigen recognition-like domain-containing protein n=1 Tax=Oryzias sinensis TaxID=183150 RepID=A0A8C8DF87_9TELE